MTSRRKTTLAGLPPPPDMHRVTRKEWDATMRAALSGLIARQDDAMSYSQTIAHARVYAYHAHGVRPSR